MFFNWVITTKQKAINQLAIKIRNFVAIVVSSNGSSLIFLFFSLSRSLILLSDGRECVCANGVCMRMMFGDHSAISYFDTIFTFENVIWIPLIRDVSTYHFQIWELCSEPTHMHAGRDKQAHAHYPNHIKNAQRVGGRIWPIYSQTHTHYSLIHWYDLRVIGLLDASNTLHPSMKYMCLVYLLYTNLVFFF